MSVTISKEDVNIIRAFIQSKFKQDYVMEWTDEQCVNELTHWLYENSGDE